MHCSYFQTYPTLLAAVEMDDTGSTRIGKYVFNHPFFIPGVATISTAVAPRLRIRRSGSSNIRWMIKL
ncbi:hypothetical protein O9993_22560 [Vibrio lentus]|nr:hypothetical protein [Vibrio lentus]